MDMNHVQAQDPETHTAIMGELDRQRKVIELIASENIVSKAVLQAMGSWMTNKYAEGYPSKRYYGGNEFVDVTEQLAIERAKKLFGADHANVQPHAGSQANMEAYFALLELKDPILAMSLDHGGHLTHGHKVNFSGSFYNFNFYGVEKETGMINMDEVRRLAREIKPKLIITGASAYPRFFDFKAFKEIADEVGAMHMCDMAHIAGLIAAKLHPDPVPHSDVVTTTTHKTLRGPRGAMILCKEEHARAIDKAVFPGMQGGPLEHVIAAKAIAFGEALQPDFVAYQQQVVKNAKALGEALMDNGFKLVSGGTDNHLLLIDLTNKDITGKEAENALDHAGLCCNKNMIPFDPRTPFNPSGIRIGTPAITTRGMREEEMKQIAEWMTKIVHSKDDQLLRKAVREEVLSLCARFPIYG